MTFISNPSPTASATLYRSGVKTFTGAAADRDTYTLSAGQLSASNGLRVSLICNANGSTATIAIKIGGVSSGTVLSVTTGNSSVTTFTVFQDPATNTAALGMGVNTGAGFMGPAWAGIAADWIAGATAIVLNGAMSGAGTGTYEWVIDSI